MAEEPPGIMLPLKEAVFGDAGDGQAVLGVTTTQGTIGGLIPPEGVADLALRMIDWLSRTTGHVGTATARRPALAHHMIFEAGPDEDALVLAVDLGAATLRFELPKREIAAAVAQLLPREH